MQAAQSSLPRGSAGCAPLLESPRDWKELVRPLDSFLKGVASQLLAQVQAFDGDLACFAEYALASQGKQIRPALVGLSASAAGGLKEAHRTAAVIIEMVHLATLIHDDVIDEATLRRGRPTLAANWGNELSVLFGDCLFAHALELASGFPTPEVCRAVSSSTNVVCSGEILQSQQRRQFGLTRADYFKVVAMKTGELFALSCDMGAFLSGARPEWRAALRDYGMALGTAYQVFDDCLDVFGAEASAGKSLGTDLAKGKITLPVLIALEAGDPAELELLKSLLGAGQPGRLPELLPLLKKRNALAGSREAVADFLERAVAALAPLPDSVHVEALRTLASLLLEQSRQIGTVP